MKLSPNFTLEELTASQTAARLGIDNSPGELELSNLKRLAEYFETIRFALGRAVYVTSALRVLELNRLIGSKDSSDHIVGCAGDIKVPGMTPDEVIRKMINANVRIHQVIREFDSWVHVSIPRTADGVWKNEILIIDKKGVRLWPSQF